MARIVAHNDGAEIHLDEALDAIGEAVEAAGMVAAASPRRRRGSTARASAASSAAGSTISCSAADLPASGPPEAAPALLAAAMAIIPNDDVHYDQWIRLGYAAYRAWGGSKAGFDAWDQWSQKSKKYQAEETKAAWRRIAGAVAGGAPRTIGAGTIFFFAAQEGWVRHPEPPPNEDERGGTRRRPHTAATSTLPPFYDAPTEDRGTAKARQDAAMREHMAEASRNAHARHELRRRRAEAIDAAGGKDALTPGQKAAITRKLHREIAAKYGYGKRLPPPPRRMFSGAQGSGKTTFARQFAAALPGIAWWITELTFEKSVEEHAAYRREAGPDSPPAMLILGRERPDPGRPGHFMCDRHVAARHIAEAGLSVPELLCKTCEFRDKCGDHRQRNKAEALVEAGRGAVFFLAGNYVFLASPAPAPDYAILDETLLRLATQVRFVPIAELATLSVLNIDTTSADTHETLRAIVAAFTVPHPTTPARVAAGDDRIMPRPLASLRHDGIDRAALRYLAKAARADLERQTPHIDASMNDVAIEAALNGGNRHQLRQLLGLISALLTEIDLPRETTTGVWHTTVSGAPALCVARLQPLRGLKHAAITVLDGTGKLSLARKLFGDRLAETRILFERQAQDVLELVREDELVQAIDRLRSVWHRRQIVLLNNLCVVPLSPEDLHHAHPAIFRTPKAAEHARKNYPINPQERSVWDCGVVSYRRSGQRGPDARALLDRGRYPGPATAIPAIEAAIGCKLQAYEGVILHPAGGPPAAGPMVQPEPWMAPAPRQAGSGAAPPSVMVHGPPAG
jgi:hypothetical protein